MAGSLQETKASLTSLNELQSPDKHNLQTLCTNVFHVILSFIIVFCFFCLENLLPRNKDGNPLQKFNHNRTWFWYPDRWASKSTSKQHTHTQNLIIQTFKSSHACFKSSQSNSSSSPFEQFYEHKIQQSDQMMFTDSANSCLGTLHQEKFSAKIAQMQSEILIQKETTPNDLTNNCFNTNTWSMINKQNHDRHYSNHNKTLSTKLDDGIWSRSLISPSHHHQNSQPNSESQNPTRFKKFIH